MNHTRTEIPITQISGIAIGQVEDRKSATGCTVLLLKDGLPTGLDIRGGGPATRETGLLDPNELQAFYPEFVPYQGQCFFSPCAHVTEPKCAVRAAVAAGEISEKRHERYAALLEETKIRWRERYD